MLLLLKRTHLSDQFSSIAHFTIITFKIPRTERDIIIVGKISFLLGLLFYTGQKAGDSRRSPAFCLPII